MEKYLGKYRNDSTRLSTRDYAAPGSYFVTTITQGRKDYFGKIGEILRAQDIASLQTVPANGQDLVQLTEIGKIAVQYWEDIPLHFPFVIQNEYIIMPNHIHGLLTFEKKFYLGGSENLFAPQSKNLASVIRGYKAAVKKYATLNKLEFAWQPRYHERVVRLDEMTATRRYIRNNPTRWLKDHSVRTQDLASQNGVRAQDPAQKTTSVDYPISH